MSPSTADGITVHRCVVRVIRRGGWSWGPDPQRLVQQAMNALPDLLADHFAEQLAGDGPDVEITEPVILNVQLRQLSELAKGFATAEVVLPPATDRMAEPAADPAPDTEEPPLPASTPQDVATPATLFAELAERGELDSLLALLPPETLRMYLLALLADVPAGGPIDETTIVGRLVAELTRRLPTSTSIPETGADIAELLLTSWPADSPSTSPHETVSRVESVPEVAGEQHVSSVLPFLLAGPLARIGYLDAIGPALAGADLLEEAPLFAAALAYKVLGAAERGWRRTEQDNAAAAAFAGLESIPDLTGFAQHVRPVLPVLDGVLALSLCRGHEPTQPLLLTGADGGLLLVDAQGMFPIAWVAEVTDLVPHWTACGRPPVIVCDSPLPPTCLRDLAAAGIRFVTDVRPLRGDPATRLPWRTPLWTFGETDVRLAADLPVHAAQLADLVQSLVIDRRAVPLAEDGALERSVTLAASLGLGTIAWMLWRERETPDPILALTRFADLEATVRFTPDAVKVRVPMGRRHADLLRSGALTDVPNVVWLAGRTLTFSGG
jgi:hypothetical protein